MDPLTGAKDILLPKLEELRGKEYELNKAVREDLIFLDNKLTSIQEWTREARDLSYDIEHVVLKFWARRFRPADPPAGLNGCLAKLTFKPATPSARRKFASEINGFKVRLTELAKPRTISVADELVGLDGPVDELAKKILADEEEEEGSTSNRNLKVASIVGPAGVGKTTLAKQVYKRLNPRFDCAAFVSMSTTPDIKKVLWDLLTQISLQDDAKFGTINVGQTMVEITKALQNKRYFIVFDDVRDIKAWETIKSALIGKGKGTGAVLTTCRRDDIAADVGGPYQLEHLQENFSRKLFYNRLFGSEEKCPPELAEICTAMIPKCCGIPSDIIRATSLLAAREGKDWQAVLDTYPGVAAPAVPAGVVAVAAPQHGQSLATVPPNLKPCLLYLSMFEKGCKISVDRLVWEWIAEGFIPMKNRKQGEEYLRDLIERNFMEAVEVDAGGNALSCRVHVDKVHDSIVKFTSEEKSVTILDGQGVTLTPRPESVRRLSIQGNRPPPSGMPLAQVRSLVVSGDAKSLLSFEEDCGDNSMPYLSKFENVRVLDLWGCRSLQNDHLMGIGSLVLLTCLVVRGDCITDIPVGIGSLVFLQTLDLRATSVKELPESIVRAKQLRCLRVNGHTKIPHGIEKLEALEELGDINISKPELLKELCSLTKLMVLGIAIWSWDESYDKALLDYLSFLFMERRIIQSLSILTCCSLDFLKELHEKWDPPGLQKIEIRHITFHKLPGWISSVQNLCSLSIELYKLSDDIVRMLGKLQNLFILSLTSKHAPEGELFGSSTEGFSKLTSFHFASNAMRKIFGLGAMRKLERIKLSFHVLQTKDVSPSFDFGLDNLSSLKHVHVEIICVNASPRVVEEAEAAIHNAIRSGAHVEKERVGKEEMLKNEEEEVGQVFYWDEEKASKREKYKIGEGKTVEDIRSPDKYKQSSESANKMDEVGGLLTQLMIDNMHHQLQLLNHDSKVKETLRDIRLNDDETRMLIQAARDRSEDLMKQVLDVGCGPSDKSGIVERFYNLRKSSEQHKRSPHGTNSTIGKTVRKPAGAESTSMFGKPNATVSKTPQMEHHETHNVSEGKGEEVEDNQYDFEVKSLKPIKAIAENGEVVPRDMKGCSSKYAEPIKPLASVEIRHLSLAQRARDFILSDAAQEYEGVNLICMLDLDKREMNWTRKNLKDMYMTGGWLDSENIDQIIKYWKQDTKRQHLFQSGERVLVPAHTCMDTLLVDEHNKGTTFNLDEAVRSFKNYVREDLTKAKLIFIPIIHKEHWTLYVLNMYKNSLDILDSMEYDGDILRRDRYHSDRTKMMKRLDQILKKMYPTMSGLNWENMAKSVKYIDTPKQIYSDCAFFILKFMELYDGEKLVSVPDPSKSDEMRAEYLYLMLFHPNNLKREDLPPELKILAPPSD